MTPQEKLLNAIFGLPTDAIRQPAQFAQHKPINALPTDALRLEIDKVYKKSELDAIFKKYLEPMILKNTAHQLEKFLPMLEPKHKVVKAELVEFLATIFESSELFGMLRNNLPQPVQEVMRVLLYDRYLGWFHELEAEIPNVNIDTRMVFMRYHHGEKPVKPAYSIFACTQGKEAIVKGKSHTIFALYLPPVVRQTLRKHIPPPPDFVLSPLDEAPKAQYHYNAENKAVRAAELISSFIVGERLEYDTSGKKPLKGSLKKLQTYSGLQEFYPPEALRHISKDLEYLATTLLVNCAQAELVAIENQADSAPGIGVLRAWLRNYADGSLQNYSVLESILFHIKRIGGGGGYYYSSGLEEINRGKPLVDLLATIPSGKWVTVNNLLRLMSLNEEQFYPVSPVAASKNLYISIDTGYGADKDFIDDVDFYAEAITTPLLKGSLALFAAMGMVEMVFNNPKSEYTQKGKTYLSVFDGIEAIRLTALGEYLLGKIKHYQAAQVEQSEQGVLTLDEHRYMAKLSAKNPMLELHLLEYMRPLTTSEQSSGAKLYKMDYASFLRECRDRDDVADKIERFKRDITEHLPPVWQQFFKEVLHRIEPLTEERQYRVFTLPPSPDLMRLLAQDDVLKKIIIKAEGYKILVSKNEITTLRKRLEKHGYLFSGRE